MLWLRSAGPDGAGATVRLRGGGARGLWRGSGARGARSTPAWGRAAVGVGAGARWRRCPGRAARFAAAASASPTCSGRPRGGLLATSPAVYVGVLGFVALWRVDRAIAAAGLALLALTAAARVVARRPGGRRRGRRPPPFLALTPYVVCGVAGVRRRVGAVRQPPSRARRRRAAGELLVRLERHADEGRRRTPASTSASRAWFGDVGGGAGPGPARLDWPPAVGAGERRLRDCQRRAARRLRHPRPQQADWPAANSDRSGSTSATDDVAFRRRGLVPGSQQDGATSFRWASRSPRPSRCHWAKRPISSFNSISGPAGRRKAPQRRLKADRKGEVASRPAQPGVRPGPDGSSTVPRANWRSGVNHLELRFAYAARPADAGIPDGRALSA